ncbi:MAG TPA: outer membrane beta-barrel protein [Chitinophagaceae bacterium]|nr:outer membrane beta-barrel protein [Chitinophagaceae bacterium]
MRKTLALLVFVGYLNSANAQLQWGANAGVNISRISVDNNAKPLLSFQSSAFAMMPASKLLAVQAALGYHRKGYKQSYWLTTDSVRHTFAHYDYIELNNYALLKCNASDDYRLYAGLGVYLAYLIKAEFREYRISLDRVHRFDLGANISVQMMIHQRWTIALASDMGGWDPFRGTSNLNFSAGITMGYFIN